MVWTYAHTGLEHDGVPVGGAEVWTLDWVRVPGERARLPHPEQPGRILTYEVYEVTDEEARTTRFAAASLSPGLFAFYWWRER